MPPAESMKITDDRRLEDDLATPGAADDPLANAHDFDGTPIADAAEVPLVEVSEIADAIRAIGDTAHGFAGHPEVPAHWAFTDAEVAQLAPPVAALVNRHAAARALARRSPELAVALILTRWGIRNTRLSAAIKEAEAELVAEDAGETPEAPETPAE